MTAHNTPTDARVRLACTLTLLVTLSVGSGTESQSASGPWFGLHLPPGLGTVPAVVVGNRPVRPVILPPGEARAPEFEGAAIRADLDRIVRFSRESRDTREIGSGQLWGRISGFPSATKTIDWSLDQFR